ncbi:hypothetical protein RAS1_44110 [Phycisphaerae bacterium RAS1]|nr:hypothetical protein RAS1_44110 [Phycisphaerae bacterium RAS1]
MLAVKKRASHAAWNVCALLDEGSDRRPCRPIGSGRRPCRPTEEARPLADEECPPDLRPAREPAATDRPARGPAATLAELAEQIRRLHRPADKRRCPTGLAALDRALGGGLAMGTIHELVTPLEAAPARTIALLTVIHAPPGGWILYFDTTLDFYPPAAARLGVPLERLLVIRTARQADVLWACEQALRCASVAAVVLPVRSMDPAVSRRLQLAAEAGGGIGLIIRRDGTGPTFAATRIRVEGAGYRERGTEKGIKGSRDRGIKGSRDQGIKGSKQPPAPCAPRPAPPFPVSSFPGVTDVRRCLLTVLKLRDGSLPEPLMLELPDAAGDVPDSGDGGGRGSTPCSAAAG